MGPSWNQNETNETNEANEVSCVDNGRPNCLKCVERNTEVVCVGECTPNAFWNLEVERCQAECPASWVRGSGGAAHLECELVVDGDYEAACSVFGVGAEYDDELERCACKTGYTWKTRDLVREME